MKLNGHPIKFLHLFLHATAGHPAVIGRPNRRGVLVLWGTEPA
jgi:hypothetical protein